ncbi:MAG: sigma-70 family RNA polymerase sigma factor [Dehalococcoidia bacterium]
MISGADVLDEPLQPLLASRQQFVDFVRRRVRDEARAEDIVHDSLVRALKSAPALRDEERLVPWFYRILRNAIIDEHRGRAVSGKHVEFVSDVPDMVEPSETDVKALCGCFAALLPALKPEYAEIIRALDLAEEPGVRVAERLGVTLNNLKVRHHRARASLKRQLEKACGTCAEGRCRVCDC